MEFFTSDTLLKIFIAASAVWMLFVQHRNPGYFAALSAFFAWYATWTMIPGVSLNREWLIPSCFAIFVVFAACVLAEFIRQGDGMPAGLVIFMALMTICPPAIYFGGPVAFNAIVDTLNEGQLRAECTAGDAKTANGADTATYTRCVADG